jgi:predicted ATPase with chaperone activity
VTSIAPPIQPETIEETGLGQGLLLKLTAKTMSMFDLAVPSRLAREMALSTYIVNSLIKEMGNLGLVESRGLAGKDMSSEVRYSLTSKGMAFANEALAQSQYVGPAPVPLDTLCEQLARQSITLEHVDHDALKDCLNHLVLPENIIDRLGPAVNSGRSILFFGAPGNGKTSIAIALGSAFIQTVYFPHCFEVDGHIIKFFDQSVHEPALPNGGHQGAADDGTNRTRVDPRWVACRRPVVLTGGDLTLEMLDLQFNPFAKFYEAPLHVKASGGIFIVDDFGRQRTEPQTILNRWIVPLERGHDFLTLHTGKKFAIPFDELVVFSTNIAPASLVDQASLRRLYYKIEVPSPTREDFLRIFADVCAGQNLAYDPATMDRFYAEHYEIPGIPPSGHHPKYLVDHLTAICHYRQSEPVVSPELLEMAWSNFQIN